LISLPEQRKSLNSYPQSFLPVVADPADPVRSLVFQLSLLTSTFSQLWKSNQCGNRLLG